MHYSAKRGIEIACRPSVRLPVTLVDQDQIGWKSWELITRTISPSPRLALRSPMAIHLFQEGHGEILGRLEVGWEKVACWSTKVVISLKCVKIEEKLLWGPIGTHQRFFEQCHPRPPEASSSHDWGFATPPKTSIAIISGTGKATDFKFGRYIHRVHPNKTPQKFWRTGSVGVHRTAQIFKVPSIISGTGKATKFKFLTHIHRIDRNKSPLEISGKSNRGRN